MGSDFPISGMELPDETHCNGAATFGCGWLSKQSLVFRPMGKPAVGQGSSIDRQRRRGLSTDPYPLNDIGPEVVGGRPREFANPLPEVSRNELTSHLYPSRSFRGYPR